MTSIIPLQKPHNRKRELTRMKVKVRFLPSSVTNSRLLFALMVVRSAALPRKTA